MENENFVTDRSQGDQIASVATLEFEITERRNSLSTDRLDMSFGEIMSMYERKEIIISPEFQRLFRWSIEQQTRFIESLLLGIPIPPIFVAEGEEGKWELVDGLQRLSTVLSFFGLLENSSENKWFLIEGDLISSLEGYNIDSLPIKYVLNLKRTVCRVEVIKWDSQWDMRYELFSRLNTGGEPLTDQEIRNSIFRGKLSSFYKFLEEMSQNEEFQRIIAISDKQKRELYDQELVIRFMSLFHDWEKVATSVSVHMTNFMRDKSDTSSDLSIADQRIFEDVIHLLSPHGKEIFRFNGSNLFSPSLFEAITIATSTFYKFYHDKPTLLQERIGILKNDEFFKKYSGSASGSKQRAKKRIQRAIEIFEVAGNGEN